jgi:hypothetical protein
VPEGMRVVVLSGGTGEEASVLSEDVVIEIEGA